MKILAGFFVFLFGLWGVIPVSMYAQERQLILPIGHHSSQFNASLSDDGRFVLSAYDDGLVKIWNAISGNYIMTVKGTGTFTHIKLSKDYQKVLISDFNQLTIKKIPGDEMLFSEFDAALFNDWKQAFIRKGKKIILWDVDKKTANDSLSKHTGDIKKLVLNKDNSRLLSLGADSLVILWDVKTRQPLATYRLEENIEHIQLTSDEKKIVVRGKNILHVINLETTKNTVLFRAHQSSQVRNNVATKAFEKANTQYHYLPRTNKLLTTLRGKTQLWNLISDSLQFEKEDFPSIADYLVISPNEKYLIYRLNSNTDSLSVWDIEHGEKKYSIINKTGEIYEAGFFADGGRFFMSDIDGLNTIYETASGKVVERFKDEDGAIHNLEYVDKDRKIIGITENVVKGVSIKIWDSGTKNVLTEIRGHTDEPESAVFSPDGRKILVLSETGTVKVFDLKRQNIVLSLAGQKYLRAIFDGTGKQVIIGDGEGWVRFFDTDSGLQLRAFKADERGVDLIHFAPDKQTLLTVSANRIKLWSLKGLLLQEWKEKFRVADVQFSADQKMLLTKSSYDEDKLALWDIATAKPLLELKNDGYTGHLSPDSKKLLLSNDKEAQLYDIASAKRSFAFERSFAGYHALQFSPSNGRIIQIDARKVDILNAENGEKTFAMPNIGYVKIYFSTDGKRFAAPLLQSGLVDIFDADKGTKVGTLTGHQDYVKHVAYSPNGEQIITSSKDNTLKIWDAKTNQLICSFLAIDTTGYFVQTPEGYYMASPNASRKLSYLSKNLNTVTFEQLDIRFNRPDKVLEKIGAEDDTRIQYYRKLYEKRIRKLNIDTASFGANHSIPVSDFTGRETIAPETSAAMLALRFTGEDENYPISRLNIWVNGCPILGTDGGPVQGKAKKNIDTVIHVALGNGTNKIEATVTNSIGLESFRSPLYVMHRPEKPVVETVHFIGVGIDKYANKSYNLAWSVKDIRDLARAFQLKYGNRVIIDTIFDRNVTKERILQLKQKLMTTDVNDKVVMAFSGHGLVNEHYDYFLSTYNVNFNRPAVNALPYEQVEDLLDGIPARKKLLLIDACHSGELDKEEVSKIHEMSKNTDKDRAFAPRGVKVLNEGSNKGGVSSSAEVMQQLFANVSKNTGATIISAASGTQFAYEKGELQNGVFTYSILELMRKNTHASIVDMKKYVNVRVFELTNGLQRPTTRSDVGDANWMLW